MFLAFVASFGTFVCAADSGPQPKVDSVLARGKYLVAVGGCNDCHTPGWSESHGTTPVADWLTGSAVGYRGPWGTTYAANLRLSVAQRGETAWVAMLKSREGLPPMPWSSVRWLSDDDARALYRFITSLGRAGPPTPKAVAAGVEPTTPFVSLAVLPASPAGGR